MEAGGDRFVGLVQNVLADNAFIIVAVVEDGLHDIVGLCLQ